MEVRSLAFLVNLLPLYISKAGTFEGEELTQQLEGDPLAAFSGVNRSLRLESTYKNTDHPCHDYFRFVECISVHCGQTGIQWGLSCWELFSREHHLTGEGKFKPDDIYSGSSLYDFNPFYRYIDEGTFKPRALFFDCDDNVVGDYLYGPKIEKIDEVSKYLGKYDCSSIYSKGVGSCGKRILNKSLERVRILLEECESPQGFIWYHSLGGGTGSGFTTLLSQAVIEENPKLKMHEFMVLPGAELTHSITDIYNSILGLQNSLENMGCAYIFDSDVLYNVCFNKLDVSNPNHDVLNRLMARIVSDVTCNLRFPSFINSTLEDMEFNLLPIRRLHFPVTCLQPIIRRNAHCYDEHFQDTVMACFDKNNQFIKCSPIDDKIIRSCLVLRGLIDMKEVTQGLNVLKNNKDFQFVTSYCRTHTTCLNNSKLVDTHKDILSVPRLQVCSITNSVAISDVFQNLTKKFDAMFAQKAFLHWYYEEGMEEQDFVNAREDLETLLFNYKDIGK